MTQAILLAIVSISLSAAAQVILKLGMVRIVAARGGVSPGLAETITAALGSPLVWTGLFVYGASALAWLGVLARLDLSLAYPFVAVGLVVTCLLGVVVFGEPSNYLKLSGIVLVAVGVLMVGLSAGPVR
jgi:multidrug transporter EmrE-like cation transporter